MDVNGVLLKPDALDMPLDYTSLLEEGGEREITMTSVNGLEEGLGRREFS